MKEKEENGIIIPSFRLAKALAKIGAEMCYLILLGICFLTILPFSICCLMVVRVADRIRNGGSEIPETEFEAPYSEPFTKKGES